MLQGSSSLYSRRLLHISSCDDMLNLFNHFLQQCANTTTTTRHQPKQIHAQIIVTASTTSAFLSARLISIYSKNGLLNDAKMVFKTTPIECFSNKLIWNSMIRANVSHGEYHEALKLYHTMQNLNVSPDGFTFPLIVKACGMFGDVTLCQMVHSTVLQMGYANNLHVVNELLGMYGKISKMDIAYKLFDRMPVRNIISWNVMVSGFAANFDCDAAFEIFSRMENDWWVPNSVTWTSLLSSFARCKRGKETWELYVLMRRKGVEATAEVIAVAISVCAETNTFDKGKMVHLYALKVGLENYSCVRNSLITMYGKNGLLKEAEYLFSELKTKSLVSWNALISSYAESGLCDEAFSVFSQLKKFDKPNVVSWSALINGFASKGRFEESLKLFRNMQFEKVKSNSVTIASVLTVCTELSALNLGREIHGHVIKDLTDSNILVQNGLINMYMKCGSLSKGNLVFQKAEFKDLFTWNTIITGFGVHGHGEDSLRAFNQMIYEGYKPDEVTFIAILSACGHSGLVNKGRALFYSMKDKFKIEPKVEHYACIVDLLGRAGLLHEASEIVKSMPIEPNCYVWGALLNSCKLHKNIDFAEETMSYIELSGGFMLLSNLYAASGRFEDSARVRVSAKNQGLKKVPGQSWIEVKNKVYVFSSGNALHSGTEDIYSVLDCLSLQMEIVGFCNKEKFISQTSHEKTMAFSNCEELILCD